MRLFLALPVPEQTQSHASQVQTFLQQRGVRGRWVCPENMHLTVLFLGDVEAERVDALVARVGEIPDDVGVVNLNYAGVAGFGRPPRVAYLAWVERERGTLVRLAQHAQRSAEAAGIAIPDEVPRREILAHLTLVRFRGPHESSALRELVDIRRREWDWRVPLPEPSLASIRLASLRLYRSTLTPDGPVYAVLHEVELPDRTSSRAPTNPPCFGRG